MTADRLRILLVLWRATGGTRTHAVSLARDLMARGDQVTIAAPPVTMQGLSTSDASRLIILNGGAAHRSSDAVTLRRLGGDHDVIHAHGLTASALTAAARTRRPLVTTWHNANVKSGPAAGIHNALERWVASASELVLTVSPDLDHRAESLGAKHRLIQVPAPILPPARLSRARIRSGLGVSGQSVVLIAARLESQKDLPTAIRAAGRWRDRAVGNARRVVLIVGEGPLRTTLQRMIDRSDAPVRLLGHRSDMADLITAADVGLISSRWEGWPLAAQEMLRSGLPLVATDLPGIRALAGSAAAYVPVGKPEAMCEMVDRVLTDDVVRADLASGRVEQAKKWLSVEQANELIRQDYLNLI